MNQFLLVRRQCLDAVEKVGFRDIHQIETNMAPILRAAQRDGLIDGYEFKFRDSRQYIHVYRSPVADPRNHHQFYCVWPSVIADMKEAIDVHG